jgi:dynein heavy chain
MDYEEELKIIGKIQPLVNMFKFSHKFVEGLSNKYLHELRRNNYVTPTSYLELLHLFKSIIMEKNKEVENKISRLQNGL